MYTSLNSRLLTVENVTKQLEAKVANSNENLNKIIGNRVVLLDRALEFDYHYYTSGIYRDLVELNRATTDTNTLLYPIFDCRVIMVYYSGTMGKDDEITGFDEYEVTPSGADYLVQHHVSLVKSSSVNLRSTPTTSAHMNYDTVLSKVRLEVAAENFGSVPTALGLSIISVDKNDYPLMSHPRLLIVSKN